MNVTLQDIFIKPVDIDTAKKIIVKNHYSHRWTPCSLCFGVYLKLQDSPFFEGVSEEKLIGAIVYGVPAGRYAARSVSELIKHDEVWELKRLWIDDITQKNTESFVIAKSIEYIEKHRPEIKCLISYSDPAYGHVGTIYKATNWIHQRINENAYNGLLYSFDQKEWVQSKTIYNRFKTTTISELPKPLWTKPNSQKIRYLKILGNKIQKKAILASLKYPPSPFPTSKTYKVKSTKYT